MAAKPLRVEWNVYEQGTLPAQRLVLYRGEEGGALMPYKVFRNMERTQFVDKDVTHDKTYCYNLLAVSEGNVSSDPTQTVCAIPRSRR